MAGEAKSILVMPELRPSILKASFVMEKAPLVRSSEALKASLVTSLVAVRALESSASRLKAEASLGRITAFPGDGGGESAGASAAAVPSSSASHASSTDPSCSSS